jgi:hypothetical protein
MVAEEAAAGVMAAAPTGMMATSASAIASGGLGRLGRFRGVIGAAGAFPTAAAKGLLRTVAAAEEVEAAGMFRLGR